MKFGDGGCSNETFNLHCYFPSFFFDSDYSLGSQINIKIYSETSYEQGIIGNDPFFFFKCFSNLIMKNIFSSFILCLY